METIRNYVEALFATLPQNDEVLRLKSELLVGLEDKFSALLAEGKSEAEATGLVLASVGSVDELRAELGLPAQDAPPEPPPNPPVSAVLAEEYRAFQAKMGAGAAAAIALFLLAPAFYPLVKQLWGKSLAIVLFFLLIAGGAAILTLFGVRAGYYKELLGIRPASKQTGRLTRLFACVAFPAALLLYLLLGFFLGMWKTGWLVFGAASVVVCAVYAVEEYRRQDKD